MIELEGLTKQFDDLLAVDQVSLSVRAGEVLALLGPNGAGKTTTVRMLSSILKPTAGKARVAGYDVVKESPMVRSRVGLLTEAPGLYNRMTGNEYLDFFGKLRGLSMTERMDRIAYLSDWFKMRFAMARRVGDYSKGMTQKIALMRTLLHDPPVLLLDEPTSAMDPESARLVRDAISQMRDNEHRSIIICSHNLPEAEELADRIAIIQHGRIIEQGTVPELKSRLLGPPLMEVRLVNPLQNGVLPLMESVVSVVDHGDLWARYSTTTPEVTNPALLKTLTDAGVSVLSLREVPQSLESVYLSVVAPGS